MKQDTFAVLDEITNPVDYIQYEKWLLPETWKETQIHLFSKEYEYSNTMHSKIRFSLSSCPCIAKFLNFLYQHDLICPEPQVFMDYTLDGIPIYFPAYVKYDIAVSTIPETFGEKYIMQVCEMLFNR